MTSTDYVPDLLGKGRIRASAEGLSVDFRVADAEDLPFELLFHRVLGFQMLELDAWGTQNEDLSALSESCFEEVENSMWLKRLHVNLERLRHFRLATYDDVFDVLCETCTCCRSCQ